MGAWVFLKARGKQRLVCLLTLRMTADWSGFAFGKIISDVEERPTCQGM